MPSLNRPVKTDTKPWYKQFWPWLIIFFPATAVVAGIITVIIAVKSDDGLVESEYYKKGLLINFSKEMDQKAAELGISGFARVDVKAKNLYLLITEASPQTQFENFTVTLKHATRAEMDQQIVLTQTSDREFGGELQALAPGKWYVRAEVPDTWRITGTVQYPDMLQTKLESSAAAAR